VEAGRKFSKLTGLSPGCGWPVCQFLPRLAPPLASSEQAMGCILLPAPAGVSGVRLANDPIISNLRHS